MPTRNETPSPTAVAPHWRYDLSVEINATDAAVLVDGLAGEPFGLRARLGVEELERRIRELDLRVRAKSDVRWTDFERDIEILSIYLPQDIVGRELHVQEIAGLVAVDGWKIAGRRGETARLWLDVDWDPEALEIVDRGEDVADVIRRWDVLPEWIRSSLRAKHPSLGRLHRLGELG
jgi:hypothetical protein